MVSIKTKEQIEFMAYAGKVAYDLLNLYEKMIKPGVTTIELNNFAEEYVKDKNCILSCKGFEGYPASICTSINEEVVHGIPSYRKLKNGDIITIDLVVEYNGFMADTARTYKVGSIDKEKEKLLTYTKEALYKGLSIIKEGVKLNEVSKAIESVAIEHNLGVVRELTGHGIGCEMHEDPYVLHYASYEPSVLLVPGMVITIEPMINEGSRYIRFKAGDDWTSYTKDGKLSAQWEHTIVITEDGYEVVSK